MESIRKGRRRERGREREGEVKVRRNGEDPVIRKRCGGIKEGGR